MNSHGIPDGSIVVGVDGSHHSDHAILWAARHAANESRTLTLVHAVTAHLSAAAWAAQGGLDPTPYLKDADAAGNAVLRAARERATAVSGAIGVEELLIRADPRTALLDVSDGAQCLVLGSRGRGPVSSLLLGSVSAAIAGHGSCPVVVVRPHHPGLVRRGVLVGADGTASSVPVLDFAFRQASELGLPLLVLHVAPQRLALSVMAGGDPGAGPVDDSALTLSETLVGMGEKFPDVLVTRQIVQGRADSELLTLADGMDLVVVGHHRQNLLARATQESVALGILEHTASVVAVVPQDHV
jgi:nucleotide-binding universal stress UspA family protein